MQFRTVFSLIAIGLSKPAHAQGRYKGHSFSNFEAPVYSSPAGTMAGDSYPTEPQFSNESLIPSDSFTPYSTSNQGTEQASSFPGGLLRLNSTMTRPLLDFVNRQSEKEILLMSQGSFQMRQAYVTFGDLSQSPLYAWIGKKTVNFGDMGTLSPFSQSMVWHYFAPLAEGAGVGYSQNGLTVNLTALNGSRGIRVVDSEQKGHINNFAANMRYEMPLANNVTWAVGGGFLDGTIYDAAVAEHTNPNVTGPMNGAWDANTQLVLGPWIFEGEIARTINPWPATAANVTAWKAEAAHDLAWIGRPLRLSASYSEGTQGPVGSQFEFNRQFVAGLRYIPHPSVTMSLEYVQSTGFAPLIDIITASDRNVIQNSVILGVVLAI